MKSNKGFTLIEILILGSIIGILAATAMPYFIGKDTTYSNSCTIHTDSNSYTFVDPNTIVETDDKIQFQFNNNTVTTRTYSTDIVCSN